MVVQQVAQLRPQGLQAGRAGAQRAHERRRVVQRGLQVQALRTGERVAVVAMGPAQAMLGRQHIQALRVQLSQGAALAGQVGQQAHVAQQQQFKGAQNQLLSVSALCQQLHGKPVMLKQGRVRVVSRQQAHEQFVEVAARQQGFAGGHHMPALPLGCLEGAHFSVTAPAELQRLQRQEHRAKLRRGALHTLGHQRNATLVAGENLQNQARLAPVVAVQDKRRLVRKPARGHHS